MNKIANKWVLVTGASSGIGASLAEIFAKQHANIVLVSRSGELLEKKAEILIKKYSIQATCIVQDLSKPHAVLKILEKLNILQIEVDILINNAGYGRWGNFLEFEQIDYQHMLQLNIQALVDLSYALLPRMIKLGSGGIINVASTAAFMPIAGFAVYSASKSFVLYFTEALHGEVAETGVTISCLCPGATNTKFSQVAAVNYPSMADTFHGISPDLVATKCLQGFIQCKLLIVPGGIKDKIAIFIPRILSRKYTIFTVKKIWSKMRGILK